MTMEYRIKFQNGEWTVTQHLDPAGLSGIRVDPPNATGLKQLGSSYDESKSGVTSSQPQKGGGNEDDPGPGGGGSGMIVVFGPVVISGPAPSASGAGGNPAGSGGTGQKKP